MANNKTNLMEQAVLQTFLQESSWTGGPLQIALFTTLPAEDESGGVEVDNNGTGYSRQSINFDVGPSYDGNNDAFVSHQSSVVFGPATSGWGTVVGIGIFDTNNNVFLYFGDVGTPQAVNATDSVIFAPGAIVVTEK